MKDDDLAGIQCSRTQISESTRDKNPGAFPDAMMAQGVPFKLRSTARPACIGLKFFDDGTKLRQIWRRVRWNCGLYRPAGQNPLLRMPRFEGEWVGLACVLLEERYSRRSNNRTNGKSGNCATENAWSRALLRLAFCRWNEELDRAVWAHARARCALYSMQKRHLSTFASSRWASRFSEFRVVHVCWRIMNDMPVPAIRQHHLSIRFARWSFFHFSSYL